MQNASDALSGSRKNALYIGSDGVTYSQMARALTLLYDLSREEIRAAYRPSTAPDLVFIQATGPDAFNAVELIPGIRDSVGSAPVFVIIDSRDADILLAASKQGIQGFVEIPDDIPNLLSIVNKEQQRSSGAFAGVLGTFFSLKGGVGTTTLAVNVAEQLALYTGGSAILVDVNMPLGDSSLYIEHDERENYSLNDFILNINRMNPDLMESAIARHKSGLRYLGLPNNLADLECVTDVNIKMVLTVLRRYYNYVIVDCASDFSPVTLACLDDSSFIMLVAEPSLSSIRAVRIAYDTCRQLGYSPERLKFILNRRTDQGDEIINELLGALQIPVTAEVENNYMTFLEALQKGCLLNEFAPQSLASRQIRDIASLLLPEGSEQIMEQDISSGKSGWFGGLFGSRSGVRQGEALK